MTPTDTIRISVHSQRYIKDTYEASTDAMGFTSYCDAVRSDFKFQNTIQFDNALRPVS